MSDISTLPVVRSFARLEGLAPCAACDEECFSWTFQTADGEVIAGTNRLTVCRIASVDVWSEKGGTSPNPPPFPGQTAAAFCVTNSASPDRHYPVFFCDVVDTNLCIQPYSVEYRVATLPEDLNLAGAATSLTQLDGPPSGSFRNAQGKTGSMVTNAWKVSDQKERRLWPNPAPADNHTTGTLIRDFNFNFISPGFIERIP